MKDYQPFAISNFRTGFNESLEPWMLPRDAYQVMVNAHLYRGVLEKIEGYRLYARFTNRSIISLGTPDGITDTFEVTLPTAPVNTNFYAYGTIVTGTSSETFLYDSDASFTVINLSGSAGGTGTVDLTTNKVTIKFNTAPPLNTYSCIFFVWDSAPASATAIMGIKQYFNSNGGQDILVFDEKRVGKVINTYGILAQQSGTVQTVSEIQHEYLQSSIITGTGAVATYSGTLAGAPFMPGSLKFTQYTSAGVLVSTATDNGSGSISGTGVTSGSVNYVTGDYTITYSANVAAGNVVNATTELFGDLFTGDNTNFFSLANYQSKAFFTNNVDLIMYYDGAGIRYLNTNLATALITASAGKPNNLSISRCLHVFVNRERLLLISVVTTSGSALGTIFWSTARVPLDFTNGEFLQAPTSEPIRAIGFINSDLVVRFASSERVFRYTGDAFSPFRWDSTNNVWACDAPYSSINYDSWFSTVGRPAIVGSDAVNVKRVDEIIPDFTSPTRLSNQTPVPFMNQTSVHQCYGERFDDLKEGWLCYNSQPQGQLATTASNNVLAFNYLDSTYAIYSFPFSCLGFGRVINVPTWGTTFTPWEDMASTWDSFQLQSNALLDLGGDQYDSVYEIGTGNTCTLPGDPTTTPSPVLFSVITKNFNPFVEQGQLCRFGYMDLFVSADVDTTLRVQFYVNDQLYTDANDEPAGYYKEVQLTFDPKDKMSPNTNQTKVWKRIYVNAVGKEHTIRFYQTAADLAETEDQPIYIHAMVLYMKPAGILFN